MLRERGNREVEREGRERERERREREVWNALASVMCRGTSSLRHVKSEILRVCAC